MSQNPSKPVAIIDGLTKSLSKYSINLKGQALADIITHAAESGMGGGLRLNTFAVAKAELVTLDDVGGVTCIKFTSTDGEEFLDGVNHILTTRTVNHNGKRYPFTFANDSTELAEEIYRHVFTIYAMR